MVYKKSPGDVAFRVINTIILSIIGILTLYPVWWLVVASVSNPLALWRADSNLIFWPVGFSLDPYRLVLENTQLWRAYGNTIFYTFFGTIISVSISMMGGYVLSRKYLPGRGFLTMFIVFTMFFSGGLIPFFLVVNTLGLTDTRWVMLLPTAVNVFFVIMILSFCRGIPDEMEESARMDGSNDWNTFIKVMMPLSKAVIAVMVLFYAVQIWNMWLHPRIFLSTRALLPLQVIMNEILILNNSEVANITGVGAVHGDDRSAFMDSVQYAVIVVSMIPIVALYPFIQKHFMHGVMIGAVKG